jgi:hypothetical protein
MIVTWHSFIDERSCPKCTALNGVQWFFDVNVDLFPDFLSYSDFGVVWNCLNDVSMAHGGNSFHCRCHVTCDFDDANLTEKIHNLKTVVYEEVKNLGAGT